MAKITIEFSDVDEARGVIDFLTGRSDAPLASAPVTTPAPEVVNVGGHEEPAPGAADAAKAEVEPEFDSIGMQYDPDIHNGNKTKNQDGTWKARKGKAAEAKAAADAFKAGGGAVHAGEPAPVAAPAAPAAPAMPAAMPTAAPAGMPSAAAEKAEAAPISQEGLTTKLVEMLDTGKLLNVGDAPIGAAPQGSYQAILDHLGLDRSNPEAVLSTNESKRAQFYEILLAIENAVSA